jgi:hypothetical protein
MYTRFAREYTMFAPAEICAKWCEQRPSNMGDLRIIEFLDIVHGIIFKK